jgi:hypothetical protein
MRYADKNIPSRHRMLYISIFYFIQSNQHIFNSKARVKEIRLYCKDKTTQQLQDEILNDPVLKDG